MSRAVAIALEVAASLIDGAWCQGVEAARCSMCRGIQPTCEGLCDWRFGGEFGPIAVGECHPCAVAWSAEGALVRAVRCMGGLAPDPKTAEAFGFGNSGDATLRAALGELARTLFPGAIHEGKVCWTLDDNGEPIAAAGVLMTWNDAKARTEPQVIAAMWRAAENARRAAGEYIE